MMRRHKNIRPDLTTFAAKDNLPINDNNSGLVQEHFLCHLTKDKFKSSSLSEGKRISKLLLSISISKYVGL